MTCNTRSISRESIVVSYDTEPHNYKDLSVVKRHA